MPAEAVSSALTAFLQQLDSPAFQDAMRAQLRAEAVAAGTSLSYRDEQGRLLQEPLAHARPDRPRCLRATQKILQLMPMPLVSSPLLLYSKLTLDDQLFTIILWWPPQLLWIGLAALILWVALIRLRHHWLRWVLVFVPYAMIGFLFYIMWGGSSQWHKWDYILEELSSERFQFDWAPILLAVPGMVLWHLKLWRKQARLRAQELAAQTPPANPG